MMPNLELIKKAAETAGQWLSDKIAAADRSATEKANQLADAVGRAQQAAVAKGRQLADAADDAARTGTRRLLAAGADQITEAVADGSAAYQTGKGAVESATASIGRGIDNVKRLIGVQTLPTVQACPLLPGSQPPDGSFMVPSDVPGACEQGYIPVPADDAGGAPAAIAAAKAESVASTSECCKARPAAERERTIFYVNGVNTSPEAHCKTLKMIRDMTCAKVIGIMNSTEGLGTDLMRTGDARDMIKNEIGGGPLRTYDGFTPAVKTVQDVIVSEAGAGRPVEIYAHSEGGAITSLATIRAKTMLDVRDLSESIVNVKITSMGAAAPAWPDGPQYEHFIHNDDFIPNLVGLGDAAKQPGAGAVITRFSGRNGVYATEGDPGYKRSWVPFTRGKDLLADHYADTSYLPYMNQPHGDRPGGCGGQP